MKFTIARNVDKNKFESVLTFAEYGAIDIDEIEEKDLLDNYPQTISLKDIVFEGFYKVVYNEVVEDETELIDKVTLTVLQRVVKLDDTFAVKYEVNTSQILADELGTELINETLVCQAKTLLFESKVLDEVKVKLDAVKLLGNDFEKVSPITVTI